MRTGKFTIRMKLLGALVVTVLMFAATGAINYRALSGVNELWEAYQRGSVQRLHLLKDLRKHFGYGGAIHYFKNYLLRGEDQDFEGAKEDFRELNRLIEEYRAAPDLGSAEQKALEEIQGVVTYYSQALLEARDLRRGGANTEAIDAAVKSDDAPSFAAFEVLNDEVEQRTAEASAKLSDTIANSVSYLLITFVGVVALLVVFNLSFGNALSRALTRVATIAQRIATGDLRHEGSGIKSTDEVGLVANAFDEMVSGLREVARDTLAVAKNLDSAAAEILAATQQQATGAKEQAASVQQITATMQEVSQSGRQIAERAKEVAASAEATRRASDSGADAARETNHTMDAIQQQVEEVAENIVALSAKTQAIGDIIATVTEVAEQSNLLALNASIESVSAGDSGSRFSVVANEMKSLADQAKESTVQVRAILGDIQKGINTTVMLTEEAVKRAESGKHRADATERTILELSESADRSVQAFEQILGGSGQQQSGFEQVTQGMQDIERATQQSASSSTQLNEAARNLSSLSKQLQSSIARYEM